MKNLIFKNFALLVISVIFSACGSTIRLHDKEQCKPYAHVIINDFKDKVSRKHNNPHIIAEGKRFADLISCEMIKKDLFDKVDRNIQSDKTALLIDGDILKYQEGDEMLRSLIGLGIGACRFAAKVYLRDNETKKIIASIYVSQVSGIIDEFEGRNIDIKSNIKTAAASVVRKCSKFKSI